ncbi:response regulator [Azospirillum sp. RWY-5-1]|uniref:Response regulator n=1 Tax=Azospirillum oleiclasticum TaxID=2735135 RepID=A0ABX2TK86_9PROT|nr:response regulator [Azospirillum oleiclasticum]NYZ17390.1 response regulator [Azospirillum oleiclasticum]NYZ24767.1 response regulator [Azospirillum oleiclasticum]
MPDNHIHVLVAEDEPLAAEALAEVLVEGGYRVTVARDGLQALACIAAERPDVLIADLRMPGLSGTELVRGARLARATLPIVIVTGNPEIWNEATEPEEREGVTLLEKPVNPYRVLEAVAAAAATA